MFTGKSPKTKQQHLLAMLQTEAKNVWHGVLIAYPLLVHKKQH